MTMISSTVHFLRRIFRNAAMRRFAAGDPFFSFELPLDLARVRRRIGFFAADFRRRFAADFRPPRAPDAFANAHCVAGVDWPNASELIGSRISLPLHLQVTVRAYLFAASNS